MAQIEGQKLLDLLEASNQICFFDLECTSLSADYGSVLVGSVRPFRGNPKIFKVNVPGEDKQVVAEIRDELHKYVCWVGFYSKMFDARFLQARLLVHGLSMLEKRHHIDMYFVMSARIKTSRHSQAHLLQLLGTSEQKMSVNPNDWNTVLQKDSKAMDTMIKRCHSDTSGLRAMYIKTRHLINDVTR